MPINTQTLKQLQAVPYGTPVNVKPAADVQLQQAVGQAQPGQPVTQLAQSIGSQLAMIQAKRSQQVAGDVSKQVGNITSQAATTAGLQGNQLLADQGRGLKQYQMQAEKQLTAVDRNAKQEVVDARRQFTQDQMGIKFANERQLADYARLKAVNEQDFSNYAASAQIALERKSQLLDISKQKITQALQAEVDKRNQLLNQAQELSVNSQTANVKRRLLQQSNLDIERLTKAGAEIDIAMAKNKARTNANQQMWTSIGTVGGAVVGGVAAGVFSGGAAAPAGATAGAAIGGGLGSMIGSSQA